MSTLCKVKDKIGRIYEGALLGCQYAVL